MDAIWSVVRNNLVDSLVVKGDMEVKGLCEDCIYGKHTTHPYDSKQDIEQHPNDCVYIDLWGPASTKSMVSASYMMLTANRHTS